MFDLASIKNTLEEIYDNSNGLVDTEQKPRYAKIAAKFEELYGMKPQGYSRAPGRVNIIGEHIDYCGFAVLPAALERDMVIAFAYTEEKVIEIANTDDMYSGKKLPLEKGIKFLEGKDFWINYFIASFQHIAEMVPTLDRGFKVLISSSVPVAASVSSSAAFCVSATFVPLFLYGLQDKYTKSAMLSKIVESERSVGVACGEMDQTISLFAEAGTAKLIEFNPIRLHTVKLPAEASLVISNTLIPVPKITIAGTLFNKRVVECRVGLVLLALKLGAIKDPKERKYENFYELQRELKYDFKTMRSLVRTHIKADPFDEKEISEALGVPMIEIIKDIPKYQLVLEVNSMKKNYNIYNCAYHTYSEAERVYQFKDICSRPPYPNQMIELGELMNDSHASCRDIVKCSCDELEELTSLCRKAGALGSRLTGAGWGGCAVSLVESSKVPEFLKAVSRYYTPSRIAGKGDISQHLFATKSGSGAAIYIP